MATTTNYSWTTPDDTDLVKDGAAAIRTLGSSIDTTTKALNPSTTLGDIEYRSSTANTNTRLGIGTTNQVLSVSGGVPAWTTISSGGMTLINTGGTTLTGSSVVIGSIPATYNDLRLIIRNPKPATDGVNLLVRINGDTNTRYAYHFTNRGNNITFGDAQINVNESLDNTSAEGLIQLDFYDYANTTTWKSGWGLAISNNSTTATNFNYTMTGFVYNQTPAIDSLTIYPGSGNWTSGTAYLYGIK
jgi:hypothetical protein